jgi:type IV secretion system protein VirD4
MSQLINAVFGIVFSLLEAIVSALSEIVVSFFPSKRKEQYNADFLPANKVLSSHNTGFCLTGTKSLSLHDSYSNAIAFASSGGGKSASILIPSILKMTDSSLVVNDPSGELLLKTGTAKEQAGYIVKILNYTTPGYSEYYNPLHRVKTISDIKKISKLLIHASLGGGGKDPFWNMAAENILTVFIRFTIFHAPLEQRNLFNVLCLLDMFSGTPKKVDELFVATKDDALLSAYKSIVSTESKMLSSVVSTAKTALGIFGDPDIAAITSKDTIDFESFRETRTILYINNNVQDLKYYGIITSIFFEQFFGSIMSRLPHKEDASIFFLIDEASSLYLSILPVAISNIRKYNAGILQLYQSQHQLFDLYGIPQGRNIIANSFAKVYLPGQPLDVCRELELLLGKFQYVDDNNHEKTRSLLTLDEIRILKEAIILCGNLPPIKTKLIPYYEQRQLLALSNLPEYKVKATFTESDELETEE